MLPSKTSRPRLAAALSTAMSTALSTALAAVLAAFLTTALDCHSARASDPLPGDGIAPPVNVNIALFYNLFQDAGAYGALRGQDVTQHTHIATDIVVARYIRTFDVDGLLAGAQVFEPYAQFLGPQELGINSIPAAAPGLPGFGPGRATLSSASGFGQPNLGLFVFPVNDPVTGTYVVLGPWVDPPVSSFNKDRNLNPAQNTWVYEMEAGARTTLFGTPAEKNLSLEIWGEAYGFGNNTNSALVGPQVSADNIPPIYGFFGVHNPLQAASSTPATFREQPSFELHGYLPYQFYPATRAYFAPGFYQSFGGKQTYRLHANGAVIDSGSRTEESQLRFVLASFISPTTQVLLSGNYDVAAHGEPLDRVFEVRLTKFF